MAKFTCLRRQGTGHRSRPGVLQKPLGRPFFTSCRNSSQRGWPFVWGWSGCSTTLGSGKPTGSPPNFIVRDRSTFHTTSPTVRGAFLRSFGSSTYPSFGARWEADKTLRPDLAGCSGRAEGSFRVGGGFGSCFQGLIPSCAGTAAEWRRFSAPMPRPAGYCPKLPAGSAG